MCLPKICKACPFAKRNIFFLSCCSLFHLLAIEKLRHSQNNLYEINVLVFCIINFLQKRSQKNILVFIYSKTYSGLSPLKGARPAINSNSKIPKAQISIF